MLNPKLNHQFYTTGGTVQAGGGLYITRKADGELLSLCRAGVYAYVLTPRQLGKSSLMCDTSKRLLEEGIKSVKIDLSDMGNNVTEEQWYFGLVSEIASQLRLKTDLIIWWKANERLGSSQRLGQFLKEVVMTEVAEPVVIFIDEIDTTLNLNFTDDYFALIRSLYNARADDPGLRRLTFVLIGVATPSDLIRDPNRTPFNIGQRLDLTDFTLEEAMPLAAGLRLPPAEARRALKWVLEWTEGHPYLTQCLCRAIADREGNGLSKRDVNSIVANTFFGEMRNHNIIFVRDMLTKRAPDVAAVLNVYRDIRSGKPVKDEESSVFKSHLKLSGIVRSRDEKLQVRNSIYRKVFDNRWIQEHSPINWGKSLRRAATLGVIATMIFIVIPVGAYQWYLLYNRNKELKAANNAADVERMAAERLRQIAEEKTLIAEEKTKRELENGKQLLTQRSIALEALRKAEKARAESEEQKQIIARQVKELEDKNNKLDIQYAKLDEQTRKLDAKNAELEQEGSKLKLALNTVTEQREDLRIQKQEAEENATRAEEAEKKANEYIAIVKELDKSLPHYKSIIRAKKGNAKSAAFAYGDDHIVAVNERGEVNVSEIKEEPLKPSASEKKEITVAFNNEHDKIFVADDSRAWFWDVNAKKELPIPQAFEPSIKNTALSPDGKLLFTINKDGQGKILDALTYTERAVLVNAGLVYNANAVYKVVFNKTGDRIFTASKTSDNKTEARVWDAGTGREIAYLSHKKTNDKDIKLAAFSPGLEYVVTVSAARAYLWKINEGQRAARLKFTQKVHYADINSMDVNKDGEFVVTASNDGMAWVWSSKTGKKVSELRGLRGTLIAYQQGKLLSGDLKVLKNLRWKDILPISIQNYPWRNLKPINSVAFNPIVDMVVTGSAMGAVNLWEADTGKLIMEFHGHTRAVNSTAFSPDGKLIITASDDGTARVWDICAVDKDLIVPPKKNAKGSKQNEPSQEKIKDPYGPFKNLKLLCADKKP